MDHFSYEGECGAPVSRHSKNSWLRLSPDNNYGLLEMLLQTDIPLKN